MSSRDSHPKYVYDGLLKNTLDKYEKTKAIHLSDPTRNDKAWCPNCKHSMRLDRIIEHYICTNPQCGTILALGYKDAPLRDVDVLYTSNDPYSPTNKPVMVSVKPVYPEEYEDFGTKTYETAEEAMSEGGKRVKRDGKKQQVKT